MRSSGFVAPTAACWLAAQCSILGGVFPVSAQAQEDEIDTLYVTARKREEVLQEVPVAVSAFSEEALINRQIETVEDVARFTPGLSFAKAFGRTTERPVIRGLGNVLAGVQFGVESGAAYFVDGVYYPGDLQSLNITDVERIEVIRGPQSALYGRNTYSGAINFVTKSPAESQPEAKLRFGQDGEAEFNGAVGGELIEDVLAASLNARYYSFDGQYTNIVTGETVGDEETRSVSGVLDWTPTENLRVRTRLSLQSDDDGTRAFFLQPSELNNCFPGTRSNATWNKVTGSTNPNQYFCGDIERPADYVALNDKLPTGSLPEVPGVPGAGNTQAWTDDVYDEATLGLAFSGVDRELYYASILTDWDVSGSGWVASVALAYRDEERKTGSDSDHSSINRVPDPSATNPSPVPECNFCASEVDDADDYSVELRLTSPETERLRGMLGLFYYDQTIDGKDIRFADTSRTTTIETGVIETEEVENWAVFGMAEYDFTETVTATLEGRYFDEEKSLFQDTNQVVTVGVPFDQSIDFDDFAPRLTLNWQTTPDLLLYAIYAKGYKPGGLNGKPGADPAVNRPTYDQEESDNYEIGLKSAWFDGRLVANTALFFIDVSDIQLTTPLASSSGLLTSIVTNQGQGEVKGAELELQLAVTDDLNIGATYALADTEFTEGCDEFQWTLTSGGGQLTDFANCTGNNLNGNGNGSIDGKKFPLSSENQVSAWADFRRPLGDQLEFFANADVSWEDEKPVQVHNLAWVPDATLVNAQFGIDTGDMTLSFYGRNLTDEDAPSMVTRWLQDPVASSAAGGAGGGTPFIPGCTPFPPNCATQYPRAFFGDMRRGRNFGVEIAYRFGGSR